MNNGWKAFAWVLAAYFIFFGKSHLHAFVFILCVFIGAGIISLFAHLMMNSVTAEQDFQRRMRVTDTELFAALVESLRLRQEKLNNELREKQREAYERMGRTQTPFRQPQPVFKSSAERKIHALLKLAERPGTLEEGTAARAQAVRLAQKHGVPISGQRYPLPRS
jgi:hypothetical protein